MVKALDQTLKVSVVLEASPQSQVPWISQPHQHHRPIRQDMVQHVYHLSRSHKLLKGEPRLRAQL